MSLSVAPMVRSNLADELRWLELNPIQSNREYQQHEKELKERQSQHRQRRDNGNNDGTPLLDYPYRDSTRADSHECVRRMSALEWGKRPTFTPATSSTNSAKHKTSSTTTTAFAPPPFAPPSFAPPPSSSNMASNVAPTLQPPSQSHRQWPIDSSTNDWTSKKAPLNATSTPSSATALKPSIPSSSGASLSSGSLPLKSYDFNMSDYADCFDDEPLAHLNRPNTASFPPNPSNSSGAAYSTPFTGGVNSTDWSKPSTGPSGYSTSVTPAVGAVTPAPAAYQPYTGPTRGNYFESSSPPSSAASTHSWQSSNSNFHPHSNIVSKSVKKPTHWSIGSDAVIAAWSGPYEWDQFVDDVNQAVFGNTSFRLHQREAINAILSKRNVFVLMPTGAGKTLIYALSSLVAGGLTVVFSPLLSLIQDQVATLSQQGVHAEALTSATEPDEARRIWDDVFNDKTRLLYITPERFKASTALNNKLRSLYERGKLSTFVIDEGENMAFDSELIPPFLISFNI